MKKNYVIISGVILLTIFFLFQWYSQRETISNHETMENSIFLSNLKHVSQSFQGMSDTMDRYNEGFTDREAILYQDAIKKELNNITRANSTIGLVGEPSKSNEDTVYETLREIEKKVEVITSEDINKAELFAVSQIFGTYSSKLSEIIDNRNKGQGLLTPDYQEQIVHLLEDMDKEIEEKKSFPSE